MSGWDSYIDSMKGKGLQISGIYGKEGGKWASSAGNNASQAEVAAIVQGIAAQSFPNGIHLNGKKYTVISYTPETVTAKCNKADTDEEKYLVHVALATTCVVLGGIAGAAERTATKHVEDIRDYLRQANY